MSFVLFAAQVLTTDPPGASDSFSRALVARSVLLFGCERAATEDSEGNASAAEWVLTTALGDRERVEA